MAKQRRGRQTTFQKRRRKGKGKIFLRSNLQIALRQPAKVTSEELTTTITGTGPGPGPSSSEKSSGREANPKNLRTMIATSEKRSRKNDENQLALYSNGSRGVAWQDEMEEVLTRILGSSRKITKKSAVATRKKARNHSQSTSTAIALSPEVEEFFRQKRSNPETFHWLQQNFVASDKSFIIPRSVMYNEYLYYCLANGIRAVCHNIFGQLIRRVFPNMKASRRLGVDGNPANHHCGIKIRADSTLRGRVPEEILEPVGRRRRTTTAPQNDMMNEILRLIYEGGSEDEREDVDDLLAIDYPAIVPHADWLQYLGKHKRGIVADLEKRIREGLMEIPFEVTETVEVCRAHSEDLLFAVEDFKLDEVLNILDGFWHKGKFASGHSTLAPINYFLTQIEADQDAMDAFTKMEVVTYDQILEILLPNVLQRLPDEMLQAYEIFLKKLRPAVEQALSHHAGDILKKRKQELLDIFINEMKMRIHITTSAEAVRKFLANSAVRPKLSTLYQDLKKIDMHQLTKEQMQLISYAFPNRVKIDEESSVKFFDFLAAVSRDTRNFSYFADWLDDCIRKRFENVLLPPDQANNFNVSEEYFKMEKEWVQIFQQIRMNLMAKPSDGLGFFVLLEDLFRNYLHFVVKKKSAKRERIPCLGYDVRNEFDLVCLAEEELQQQ